MTDEEKETYIKGAKFGYNKLKSRLEQVERLKQENKELREEIAGLKGEADSILNNWCKGEDPCPYLKKLNNQLTKAKAIIKDLLKVLPKENIESVYEVTEEAEQFLREVGE